MMPWGILIPADEETPVEFRLFNDTTDYQRAVGGWFEVIDTTAPEASFFVNEEGKIHHMPLNRRATLALWIHHRSMHRREALNGDAVLIGLPDEEGQTQDVPEELVQLLLRTASYKIEVETVDAPGAWSGNQARYSTPWSAYTAALALYERWFAVTDVRVVAA